MKFHIDIQVPDISGMNLGDVQDVIVRNALHEVPRQIMHLVPNQWKTLRDANGEIVGKITRTE